MSIEPVLESGPEPGWSGVLACTFTSAPLTEGMLFWGSSTGRRVAVRYAPDDQLYQQLLDATSLLRAGVADVRIVLVRWDDIVGRSHPVGSEPWLAMLEGAAAELEEAVRRAVRDSSGRWLLVFSRSGTPELEGRAELDRVFGRVEADLAERLGDVSALDVVPSAWVDRHYPVAAWSDAAAERAGRIPYTEEYFAALAATIVRAARRIERPRKKVLVLDCDNTLWGGVLGEDGIDGVQLNGHWREIQDAAAGLADEGCLICLASKNDEADVHALFTSRAGEMGLPWETIVSHRIRWTAKSEGLREIASELSLGLDSFVFIDDSPVECARMRLELPSVLTLQVPDEAGAAGRLLRHVWDFDVSRVTEEDRRRSEMYRAGRLRDEVRSSTRTLREFLESLGLSVSVSVCPVGQEHVARAAQLTQRTNQFNSTGLRLDEVAILAHVRDPDVFIRRVEVSDRFGEYGTVGLVIARSEGPVFRIEALLLSCRALARGVEFRLLGAAAEEATRRGHSLLRIDFRPSDRNEPFRLFLEEVARQSGARFEEDGLEVPPGAVADLDPSRTDPGVRAPRSDRSLKASSSSEETAEWQAVADAAVRWSDPAEVVAELRSRRSPRPHLQTRFVPPRTDIERAIAETWSEVLRLESIGLDDRFEDLGGGSLQLVRVFSALQSSPAGALPLTAYFEHTTVRALAEAVDHEAPVGRLSTVAERAARQREMLRRIEPRRGRRG